MKPVITLFFSGCATSLFLNSLALRDPIIFHQCFTSFTGYRSGSVLCELKIATLVYPSFPVMPRTTWPMIASLTHETTAFC